MRFHRDSLYALLPAIHRLRDEQPSSAQPLRALLGVIAEEFAVLEANLDQLDDDLFIETCADWVIPYIGDLIGYQPLHPLGADHSAARAEVAHSIALRRRKGTITMLEQLARDVTGWPARAVEGVQLLGTTQSLIHLRPGHHQAPDLRRWQALQHLGGPFDTMAHSVDVRRIDQGRGRFNIANIGLFLWRLKAQAHSRSPAVRFDDRRYGISPLGQPLPLFTNPLSEEAISHLAEPIHVPDPIRRRAMAEQLAHVYGTRSAPGEPVDREDPSLVLYVDGVEIPRSQVAVCNLADAGGGAWAHDAPAGRYAIDPELGRIAVAADLPVPASLTVTYHHGFAADLGGGEYARTREPDPLGTRVLRVPGDHATITDALNTLAGDGVVEIGDSGRYEETPALKAAAAGQVILRAAPRCRPTLVLSGPMRISGDADSSVTLDGLLISGAGLEVADGAGNRLERLRIAHTTLVPGHALDTDGEPLKPDLASLTVAIPGVRVSLDHAIVGALRLHAEAELQADDSIIDATARDRLALAGPDPDPDPGPGGRVELRACTCIGGLRVREIGTISDSILLAQSRPGDALPPVHSIRRQSGCVRFSWLPPQSRTPRRHRCQPESTGGAEPPLPRFTSLRYGTPAYAQLRGSTSEAIRRGASDESEMGAFHALFPAQREDNLRIRLRENLRVGLAAGLFHAT